MTVLISGFFGVSVDSIFALEKALEDSKREKVARKS